MSERRGGGYERGSPERNDRRGYGGRPERGYNRGYGGGGGGGDRYGGKCHNSNKFFDSIA